MDTFISCGEFWRLLSSIESFIQNGDFYSALTIFGSCSDFYPVLPSLGSVETFIKCRDFNLVWGLLSTEEPFIYNHS